MSWFGVKTARRHNCRLPEDITAVDDQNKFIEMIFTTFQIHWEEKIYLSVTKKLLIKNHNMAQKCLSYSGLEYRTVYMIECQSTLS